MKAGKTKVTFKGGAYDGREIIVDGTYGKCYEHRGLAGEKNPDKRAQRNWWCKACSKFVMGFTG